MRDREGTIAMRGGEGEVGSKAKVDVCWGCPVLVLKDSNLLILMLKLTHVRSTVNGDIFVKQSWST